MLYRLEKSGFEAYIVGGGVRDILLGGHPKDFDIATDAHPEDVAKLFNNCRLIGRRFRLAHVYFRREIIEVATFRGEHGKGGDHRRDNGMILRDNVYGTLEEDVFRRDFTMNALYYGIKDFALLDFMGGLEDIKNKTLRMIGDPKQRYQEDPVRILRAIRLAGKLDFNIHKDTEQPIVSLRHLLMEVPPARLFEEMLKIFFSSKGLAIFELLHRYELRDLLFPTLATEDPTALKLMSLTLQSTDDRVKEGKPVTPAFIFAALIWQPACELALQYEQQGESKYYAMEMAMDDLFRQQAKTLAIPKRFQKASKDILHFQHRLVNLLRSRVTPTFHHNRFRAAYDFLVLRGEAGENVKKEAQWWTDYQAVDEEQQDRMLTELPDRKRRPRKKKPSNEH